MPLNIENLRFSYPDGTTALHGITLDLADGEALAIVGPNGAGKSTFVNHLNGFFLPQTGLVAVNGTELSKKTREQIRREVGVVFQNPDDQLFTSHLYDDVAFGPVNLGWPAAEVHQTVESVLRQLELWDLRDRPPYHLSQGQKRFAALAAVLAMRPSVLVLDEPTADLDPRHRRRLIRLFQDMKITRLVVSHDLDFVVETCGRTAILDEGKIVSTGPTRELLADKSRLEAHGLEVPHSILHMQARHGH
jgi:cobalt/nickel transport system ATP-binding protein